MEKIKGYGPLLLRLVLGPIFIIHGWDKIMGLYAYLVNGAEWPFLGLVSGLQYVPTWPPIFWAICATGAEFVGGIFVLIGMKTRGSAFFIAVVMVFAILGFHLPGGDNIEKQLALLAMSVSLIASGAGRWNVEVKK